MSSMGNTEVLIGRMPCATFLLNSNLDTYYRGGIYKNQDWGRASTLTFPAQISARVNGFRDFISYKFKHNINGTNFIFCITFRKKFLTINRKSDIDKYHIRLSLIGKEGGRLDKINCRDKKESMMLKSDGDLLLLPGAKVDESGNVQVPIKDVYVNVDPSHTSKWINSFSSITTGQVTDGEPQISEVENMGEITENTLPSGIKPAVSSIKENIDRLGKLLVNHCEGNNGGLDTIVSAGGATRRHTRLSRRRKSLFKRKGKKSYKKKKYGKTKKSRRFRRSVRSRR
jgi:hypothetical protein